MFVNEYTFFLLIWETLIAFMLNVGTWLSHNILYLLLSNVQVVVWITILITKSVIGVFILCGIYNYKTVKHIHSYNQTVHPDKDNYPTKYLTCGSAQRQAGLYMISIRTKLSQYAIRAQ